MLSLSSASGVIDGLGNHRLHQNEFGSVNDEVRQAFTRRDYTRDLTRKAGPLLVVIGCTNPASPKAAKCRL